MVTNTFYILYTNDSKETPVKYLDTLQELADYLGKSKSTTSKQVSKGKARAANGNTYKVQTYNTKALEEVDE